MTSSKPSATPWPWEASYPSDIAWNTHIPTYPLYELLNRTVKAYPLQPAMDFMDKIWRWDQIGAGADHLAIALQNIGIGKGSRVGICLPNTPYFLMSYFGIAKTGATIVHFNPLYAEREMAQQIESSQCDIIITLDLKILYSKLAKMLKTTRLNQLIICRFSALLPFPKNILFNVARFFDIAHIPHDDRHIPWDRLMRSLGPLREVPIDPEHDIALLQYTGGTTGLPKGAKLTHANITANAEQAATWFKARDGHDKMLGVIPFCHVFAMTAVMNLAVRRGFQIIATPRFELRDTLRLIDKKKPQIFPAVPAIFNAITTNADVAAGQYDLTSLVYCVSGGAPLPVEVKRKFEGTTGCVLVEGYGLTESSPIVCVNPTTGDNRAGSIGLPLPQTIVEIVDPATGQTMPAGERGEVCVRGPQVMQGYWQKPDDTAKVLRDGRLHTGDIGIMDADGYVYIVDRLKDMIITNGYNVYPRNVEEAIYEHPAVEECVVAGLPDAKRGEVIKTWIKCRSGAALNERDVLDFLKSRLSPMEMPKIIEFRQNPLPKTMIGKLSRKDLLAQEKNL
ncbi:MAG: long-chain fatty acid--CoA ligase [Pseudomonadota bacterium]